MEKHHLHKATTLTIRETQNVVLLSVLVVAQTLHLAFTFLY